MKKLIVSVLCGFVLLGSRTPMATAEEGAGIHGSYGVVIDAESAIPLYEKNANEKAYPASITKVLTAILAAEHLRDGEEVLATPEAVQQDPSNQVFLLREGEVMKKKDALLAMMILSSNDVTYAVAQKIGGTVENFSNMMNERAEKIGVKNSHFVTPNGLHHPDHYTTAYDMALIGREALKYPEVMEAMNAQKATIQTSERTMEIEVKNKIRELNPRAIGGKTGYTSAARNTLLEVLEQGDERVVAVVMQTTLQEEYNDIEVMANVGFEKVETDTLYAKGQVVDSQKIAGKEMDLMAAEDIKVSYLQGDKPKASVRVNVDDKQKKSTGKVVGEAVLVVDGVKVKTYPVISSQSISEPKALTHSESEGATDGGGIWKNIGLAIGIPLATYLVLNIIANVRRLKRVQRSN